MKSARTYLEYCCLSQVNRYFPKLGILSQILYCQNHSKIPPQNNQAQNAQSPKTILSHCAKNFMGYPLMFSKNC